MAQLKKKFIGNDQVGATKILLENDSHIRGRNAANSADINMLKVNGSDRVEFGSVPKSPSDASAADDLVRLGQIAGFLEGQKPKEAVAAVALANVNLAATTGGASQGGHILADGQRVLLANQTAPAQNGIYVATTAADPSTWVRSADYNQESEIPGSYTAIQFGTEAGEMYITTSSPVTLGSDPITFIKKAAISPINLREEIMAFGAGDITNQYFDLAQPALFSQGISIFALNGGIQEKGVDYSISLTGGVAGVTRIVLLGDLATGGASALVSGDKLVAKYRYV